MGIGFELFKAKIGMNLADGVMEAVSGAIEKKAVENSIREEVELEKNQIKKEQSDKNDMIKILVFMLGNKTVLDRNSRKLIASILSTIYEENISLFSIEDKIDDAYSEIQSKNAVHFFSNITSIKTDRKHTCMMYIVAMLLYMQLRNENNIISIQTYNLALIKKSFELTRSELANCYNHLAKELEKDVDDVADIFEELTTEDNIKKIESENPSLIHKTETKNCLPEEKEDLLSVSIKCENPKEEIESIYCSTIQDETTEEELKKRFLLADANPQKILAAVNAYAKKCKNEEIIAMYDDSLFCNGKVGFLITNKNLYYCNSFELPKKIELNSIKQITAFPKSIGSFINVNNQKISTSMLNEISTTIVCNFLQRIIPLAKQIEIQEAQ